MSERNVTDVGRVQALAVRHRRMTSHRSFLGHLWDTVTHTPLYSHWKYLLTCFRRFRAVTVTLRVLAILFAILETGTLVVLSTAVFLVILPLLIATMAGILITAAVESVRSNRILRKALQGRRVCILFMSDNPTPFFARHARALASEGFAVLVVSPYWIAATPALNRLKKSGFYCTFRAEEKDLYLIRRYYFFSLRKNVLSECNVSYLY